MTELYPDAEQTMPYDSPEPLGNQVNITCFVDADHAGNRITRRSHTLIIIFVNSSPIIPVEGEARILCDNESVVKIGTNPEAHLTKKHNAIAFHGICECVASKMILIYHEKDECNLTDILTKELPVERRTHLLNGLMN